MSPPDAFTEMHPDGDRVALYLTPAEKRNLDAFLRLSDEERKQLLEIIRIQPDLDRIAQGERALRVVGTLARNLALWVSIVIGGIVAWREFFSGR